MKTCVGVALMSVGPYALVALLAGAACTPALAQDDGFGNGIPLAAAAKGIVPKGYTVDMGKGVDGSVDVSWHAGDWHKKLDEAVSGAGYVAKVDGQVVHISRKGASLADISQKAPEAPPAADAESRPARVATPPRTVRRAEPVHAEPRRAEPGRHRAARVEVAETRVRRAEPGEVAEAPGPAYGPTVSASGFVLMPKREPARVAVAAAGDDDGWKPVTRRHEAAPKAAEPVKAAPAPAAAGAFVAEKGQDLATVMQEWAGREGWHVEWASEYQYRLSASARYPGGFQEAASELINSMSHLRPQPTVDFFPPNKTVVIDNRGHSETAAAAN